MPTDNELRTAIFTAGGTATELTIAGEQFTGTAYDYSQYNEAKLAGSTIFVFDNLPADLAVRTVVESWKGWHFRSGLLADYPGTQSYGGGFHNSGDLSMEGAKIGRAHV